MNKNFIENLFGIEGGNVVWYGVIVAVGMVLGVLLAVFRTRRKNLKEDMVFDFILIALPVTNCEAGQQSQVFRHDAGKNQHEGRHDCH